MLAVYNNFIRRIDRAVNMAEEYFYSCKYSSNMEEYYDETLQELEDIAMQTEREQRLRSREYARLLAYIEDCKNDLRLSYNDLYPYTIEG